MIRVSKEFLLHAYKSGYFPMPDHKTEELLWYRPDPRAIIDLNTFKPSRSLMRAIRKSKFRFTVDQSFRAVMDGCSDRSDTWLSPAMKDMYEELYLSGHAHSVEVWQEDRLVGGLYGVAIEKAFFAESKFHRISNASKAALWHLVRWLKERDYRLLEVQFLTQHLKSLGASAISDQDYQELLRKAVLF